ncbi:hypothetical protein KIM67_13045 [Flagellimonas sp. 389]|uniref:hypothetical protein n=1 Tax=Flagellimonas sp. 389 TaxID=2835862 RepID=UPI001BD30BAD|nr:hypothetical protein [Flagellimonas sp. 389]MBS9463338.1 hypothetical protein [Flagellimonas sp. 389]
MLAQNFPNDLGPIYKETLAEKFIIKPFNTLSNAVFLIILVFDIAVFFRSIDLKQSVFEMGTHWLWHFFGGVAVHCLIAYIFKDNLLNLSATSDNHDRDNKRTLERS